MLNIRPLLFKGFDWAKKNALFRTLPFGLTGILLAIFPRISGIPLISQAGLFDLLINPLTYVALAIPTIVSIYLLYEKNWRCTCHKGIMRYLHIFGVFATGLAVSFFSYFIGVMTLFFTDVNTLSGGQINNSIWYVSMINQALWFLPIKSIVWIIPLVSFPALFVMQDIFNSYDGESGILFSNKGAFAKGIRLIVQKMSKKPST